MTVIKNDESIRLRVARDIIPTLEKVCAEMARREGVEISLPGKCNEARSEDVYDTLATYGNLLRQFFPGVRFF